MYPCGFLPFKAKSLPVSAEKWISSIDSKPLFCLSLTLGRRSLWSRELPMTKHKESSRRWKRSGRISLSASPSPAALPNRLSSQYRRVFMSTPKGSKSIETSDFGVKVSILAIRSDWFWFRHEIALKKPTSNQSGESFELVLISLWNCSEKANF